MRGRPSCYGNIAWWQGPKADPARTHKWTVFLRGCQNEDLSYFIKKVVFTLHNSFEKPKRGGSRQILARSRDLDFLTFLPLRVNQREVALVQRSNDFRQIFIADRLPNVCAWGAAISAAQRSARN